MKKATKGKYPAPPAILECAKTGIESGHAAGSKAAITSRLSPRSHTAHLPLLLSLHPRTQPTCFSCPSLHPHTLHTRLSSPPLPSHTTASPPLSTHSHTTNLFCTFSGPSRATRCACSPRLPPGCLLTRTASACFSPPPLSPPNLLSIPCCCSLSHRLPSSLSTSSCSLSLHPFPLLDKRARSFFCFSVFPFPLPLRPKQAERELFGKLSATQESAALRGLFFGQTESKKNKFGAPETKVLASGT